MDTQKPEQPKENKPNEDLEGGPEADESSLDPHDGEESKSYRSRSSSETLCRICFDTSEEENLVTLCLCKGSIGKVHKSCLERWLATNNTHTCELCGYRFNTTRRPKFKPAYSIYYWIFNEKGLESRPRLCADVTFMCVLSPIMCLALYASIAVSSYYSQPPLIMSASTSWIAISMTMVSTVLSIGFYLWLTQTLHYHGESWYRWWQCKNEVIILSPPPASHRLLIETSV